MEPPLPRFDISACVNCRDDETTIRRWLDLLAPRVEEVIVCDTGSRDGTMDIIRAAPYDNIVLHQFRWPGFVAARNRFFDLVSRPFILQVDADEVLLEEFFDHVPRHLEQLRHHCDSIRLPHFRARFSYLSMPDVQSRAAHFDSNFKPFSYPRDVLYRSDLWDHGWVWQAKDGAQILNNLNAPHPCLVEDRLLHCVPPEHKLNDDEYHARKVLAYTRDYGATAEWDAFLRRVPPDQLARIQQDVTAATDDPAPHATWWGMVGCRTRSRSAEPASRSPLERIAAGSTRLVADERGARLDLDGTSDCLELNEREAFIAERLRNRDEGAVAAHRLAEVFDAPLAQAYETVNQFESRLRGAVWKPKGRATQLATGTDVAAPIDPTGAFQVVTAWGDQATYYRELLGNPDPESIQVVIELGVHWGYSLFTMARDFPQATIVGVDSFAYGNVAEVRHHLDTYLPLFPGARIIEGDTVAVGLAWRDPAMSRPIDLLHIDADHGYDAVRLDFEAWSPHVRSGGAVMFHDVEAFADTVGRFFEEIEGGRRVRRGNLGIWFKGAASPPARPPAGRTRYLELLKACLTDSFRHAGPQPFDEALCVFEGRHWPEIADTMISRIRLEDLQCCVEQILRDDIPGDFIETGVWRGGASILMRAVLEAWDESVRTVWLADSFQGLPPWDPGQYPADGHLDLSGCEVLAVPLEQVQANFRKYGLLDERVRFLKGWFRDTLPTAPVERLAILRLDGDLYASTIQALRALYPKVSPGGYVIVDDYWAIPACRKAVDDYRAEQGISEELRRIDWTAVRWRRGEAYQPSPLVA